MKVTKEDVKHIADLARLDFSDHETELLTNQLSSILDYIEKLNELDTGDVPPTTHAHELVNTFRDDQTQESIGADKALKNAPESAKGHFVVPRII